MSTGEESIANLLINVQREREKRVRLQAELTWERERIENLENTIFSMLLNDPKSTESTVDCIKTEEDAFTATDGVVKPYPPHIRRLKVLKFKAKRDKHRHVRVRRLFHGRSQAAKAKPRVHGKFIKAS